MKIVVNGDVVRTVALEPTAAESGGSRWPAVEERLTLRHDSWIHVIVEGDEPLAPIVTGRRPILPLAITNPIWVEGDSAPGWSSPWEWARRESLLRSGLDGLRPGEAALVVLAAVDRGAEAAEPLVLAGLASEERHVRLAAMRAAERLARPVFAPRLRELCENAEDAFQALTAGCALETCEPDRPFDGLAGLLARLGGAALGRYPVELGRLVPLHSRDAWKVIGYFPNPTQGTLFEASYGPETDADLASRHEGKAGEVGWIDAVVSDRGYIDLGAIDPATRDNSISYAQTWLHVEEAGEFPYALGSDDGCRLWVNDEEIHSDNSRHGASQLQWIGSMSLAGGWNRVLIGVENGGGPTGLYFTVLDARVRAAAERP